MRQFTIKDTEMLLELMDIELLNHLIVTELSWHAEHADDLKDREALKTAAIYFGGE